MKSDHNLSSMLLFVLFFFYEARQALRQNKAHEYNSSTNIVDHTHGSSNNNYRGGGSCGGNSSRPLAPHGRGRGQAGYRSGRDDGHHYNYNINNNGGK
jgi:hypothetical protein